tara:strand:+ start:8516 stop:8908 length:393 start_codon:yes stop_codon:yes gene_type:complete
LISSFLFLQKSYSRDDAIRADFDCGTYLAHGRWSVESGEIFIQMRKGLRGDYYLKPILDLDSKKWVRNGHRVEFKFTTLKKIEGGIPELRIETIIRPFLWKLKENEVIPLEKRNCGRLSLSKSDLLKHTK